MWCKCHTPLHSHTIFPFPYKNKQNYAICCVTPHLHPDQAQLIKDARGHFRNLFSEEVAVCNIKHTSFASERQQFLTNFLQLSSSWVFWLPHKKLATVWILCVPLISKASILILKYFNRLCMFQNLSMFVSRWENTNCLFHQIVCFWTVLLF